MIGIEKTAHQRVTKINEKRIASAGLDNPKKSGFRVMNTFKAKRRSPPK